MVEIKSIQISKKSFMGIHMHLPGNPVYLIMSTKTILAQNMFDIDYFNRGVGNVSIILTAYHYGFEPMLKAPVIAMNEEAKQHGVRLEMSGKEALLLCEEEEN